MKSEPASRCLDCGHSGHLIDEVCRRAVLFGNQTGICGHRCVLSVSAVSNEPPEKLWIAPLMLRHRSTTTAVYIYDETSKQERDIEYVRADKSDFRAGVATEKAADDIAAAIVLGCEMNYGFLVAGAKAWLLRWIAEAIKAERQALQQGDSQ